MKERVTFQTNVPVTVALAYPDGIAVEGRYGDQVMYTLADERVMYVPLVVRDKMTELGVRPGEAVTLCKAERREGNRRFIEWQVGVSTAENNTVATAHEITGSPRPNGRPIDHADASTAGSAQKILHKALVASIEAALAAEQYACAKGLSVRFGSEDLRAMALSLFIQHARDGGMR